MVSLGVKARPSTIYDTSIFFRKGERFDFFRSRKLEGVFWLGVTFLWPSLGLDAKCLMFAAERDGNAAFTISATGQEEG